jgi:hypothetical protein
LSRQRTGRYPAVSQHVLTSLASRRSSTANCCKPNASCHAYVQRNISLLCTIFCLVVPRSFRWGIRGIHNWKSILHTERRTCLGSQREKADGAASPRSRAWRSLRSSPFGSSAWLDVREDDAAKDTPQGCVRRPHGGGMRQGRARVHRRPTFRGADLGLRRLEQPRSHSTGAGTTYEKPDGSLSLPQGADREAHREKRPTSGGPPPPRRRHGFVFGVSECSLQAYHLLTLVLWRPVRSGEGVDFRRHFTPSEDIFP